MFWEKEKFLSRVKEVHQHRYTKKYPIDSFCMEEDASDLIAPGIPVFSDNTEDYFKQGDYWTGRDRYVWLHKQVDLPVPMEGHSLVAYFDFGVTGDGNSSGTESLLFVDKSPYHGLDKNHREITLKEEWQGKTHAFDIRLWSGIEAGGKHITQKHVFNEAYIAELNSEVDDYYWRLRTAVDLLFLKDTDANLLSQLSTVIDHSLKQIDWREPKSDGFYESIRLANQLLKDQLADLKVNHPATVHTIGHTHIDVAWLWQLKHTREKTARSFSTVLALMDEYPEYTFLQSQPQLYKYLKEDFPEIYQKIKEKVNEGKWEVGGGMWLEADCNIPSGESLVRQFLHGYHFLKDEFGVESDYLWLPDVFGYSWALPQILQKSGIKTFMTTKISWSQYNRMPHDTFNWRGIDGTEVLTHFITTPDQNGLWYYTYNGDMSAESLSELWQNYRNKDINQDLLIAYGYGDGGGGVTKEMLEIQRSASEMPGLPDVKQTTAKDYFEKLHENISDTDRYVHTWDGELYLEYHRGTYTSQAKIKKLNREFEIRLKNLEAYCTLACLNEQSFDNYPQEDIQFIWEVLLRNQFHDIIPGTSIKEVYEDAFKEFETADKKIKDIYDRFCKEESTEWALFNSDSFTRSSHVLLTEETEMNFDTEIVETQETEEGTLVFMPEIKPYSFSKMSGFSQSVSDEQEVFDIKEHTITTPYYSVRFNEMGQIASLYDRRLNKKWIEEGKVGNELQVFEDKPLTYDAWDIDIYYQQKQYPVSQLIKMEWVEKGRLRATLKVVWAYNKSTISQRIHFYKNSPRIDFETQVDWDESQQLLKVAFPVTVRSTEATYDIQFGNVKRPTHWNTSWDYAKFETVAHKWADLSERSYGIALLNNCKYGYDIKDNIMRLSLIKSGIHPDPEADKGMHDFTYSILPHSGDWYEGNVEREAWDLNNPLKPVKASKSLLTRDSFFKIDAENVILHTIKKAEKEDKIIIRLYEYAGASARVNLSTSLDIKEWVECDLMERPLSNSVHHGEITFNIKPYEIKTFLVTV
ncbi:alpha-mannosidase [Alkalibacterium sp. s-m-22]